MEKFKEKIEPQKIEEPETQPPEFEIKEFEKAEGQFEDLLKELIPAIREHKYSVVVGDDASGRIPTRVIGDLIKEIYKEDRVDNPEVLFLVGGGRYRGIEDWRTGANYYLDKLLKKKVVSPEDKILLVTEYMDTGESIARTVRVLQEKGLTCDIATLGCKEDDYSNPKSPDYIPELKDLKIYTGGRDLYFYKTIFSGVEKYGEQILSKRRKGDKEERGLFLTSRRNVKKMVNYLKQIYDREKKKTEE